MLEGISEFLLSLTTDGLKESSGLVSNLYSKDAVTTQVSRYSNILYLATSFMLVLLFAGKCA